MGRENRPTASLEIKIVVSPELRWRLWPWIRMGHIAKDLLVDVGKRQSNNNYTIEFGLHPAAAGGVLAKRRVGMASLCRAGPLP